MKNILLLVNPKSRSGAESFNEIVSLLKAQNFVILNSQADLEKMSFTELIQKYHSEIDFAAVGGGDGSVNEALPALVKHDVLLHVIPLGTANNLARTLNLPIELKENLSEISARSIKKIDLGLVNDIYFVNVAGIGLSAKINKNVSSEAKKKLGVFAFVLTAFQNLHLIKPFRIHILDGEGNIHRSHCWQLSICNGRHYGSGLIASENASLEDGILDCISSEMGKWWHAIFHFFRFFSGKFHDTPDITLIRSKSIDLKTSRLLDIDVDGDIKTKTPAIFSVVPKSLRVFYVPIKDV